jgi:hypothetical protein
MSFEKIREHENEPERENAMLQEKCTHSCVDEMCPDLSRTEPDTDSEKPIGAITRPGIWPVLGRGA